MSEPSFPRTFVAQRDEDVSGISGEGVIAEGVQFSDGWVVTHWLDQPPMHEPKTDVWHNKGSAPFEKIHGHGGATRILWADEVTAARQQLAADIVEAFDVPGWMAGPGAEREVLRRRIERAINFARDEHLCLVDVPQEAVDAVMLVVGQLQRERDRARRAAGRAYQLADRWQAAHGASMFLVRAAGAELRDELDDSAAADAEVVHSEANAQARDLSGVDDVAAAECSALYTRFSNDKRQCIRAAQHRGDHIDEHGFHWSDTVAVYPVIDDQLPPPEGPEYTPCACGHIDPEHSDALFRHCLKCGCLRYRIEPPEQGSLGANDTQACPYCSGAPQFPRSELAAHVENQHARVLTALASGVSLDEVLHDAASACRLLHERQV